MACCCFVCVVVDGCWFVSLFVLCCTRLPLLPDVVGDCDRCVLLLVVVVVLLWCVVECGSCVLLFVGDVCFGCSCLMLVWVVVIVCCWFVGCCWLVMSLVFVLVVGCCFVARVDSCYWLSFVRLV